MDYQFSRQFDKSISCCSPITHDILLKKIHQNDLLRPHSRLFYNFYCTVHTFIRRKSVCQPSCFICLWWISQSRNQHVCFCLQISSCFCGHACYFHRPPLCCGTDHAHLFQTVHADNGPTVCGSITHTSRLHSGSSRRPPIGHVVQCIPRQQRKLFVIVKAIQKGAAFLS